ncbi:MAG TPA: hypothetical protein VG206_18805 [Terriglobia bacterium]|nr:hypothetical protein [Terriglobia bacterium]
MSTFFSSAIAAAPRGSIEKPEQYLFRGVVRRIWDLLSRKPQIEYVGSVPDLDALKRPGSGSWGNEIERNLLIEEIIALMDEETRQIHFRRARGDRWSRIAADLGISEDAAEERFRYGIEKVKARILRLGRAQDPESAPR